MVSLANLPNQIRDAVSTVIDRINDSVSIDATISERLLSRDSFARADSSRIITGLESYEEVGSSSITTTSRKPNMEPRGSSASSKATDETEVQFYLVRADFANESHEALTAGPGPISRVWKFICPPGSVRWSKTGEASAVSSYGTNTPVLIYGNTTLRQLSLSDVLIEGYSYGNEILSVIKELESLMTTVADTENGFVSPYVWALKAENTSYGLYVLTSVEIEEYMRDSSGRATRATASIQMQEVGAWQVNTGRDLALEGDLPVPDQAALDALNPDDEDSESGDGVADSDNGGIDGDADSTKPTYKVAEGATGAIVEQGEYRALCNFRTTGGEKVCLPVSDEDTEAFDRMGIESGDEVGPDGVVYRTGLGEL